MQVGNGNLKEIKKGGLFVVDLGGYKVGLFHEKDANTYGELSGGNFEVRNESEYASTATSNVVLLLDKNDKVVDLDDMPVESTFELLSERFVAFLKGESFCAFIVNQGDIFWGDEECVTTDSQGLLTNVKIISDDFDLVATLDTDSTINVGDLEEKDMLLLYLDSTPQVRDDGERLSIHLFMGCARILKTNLD